MHKKTEIINILLSWAAERELINHIPNIDDETDEYIEYGYYFLFLNKIYAESFYDKVNDSFLNWTYTTFDPETKSVKIGFAIEKEVRLD